MDEKIREWDRRVLLRIYGINRPLVTRFFQVLSYIGSTPFWVTVGVICILLTILWYLLFPNFHSLANYLLQFCANLFTAFFVSGPVLLPIKYGINRKRPYQRYINIPSRDYYVADPSFPSGHCAQWVFYGWVVSAYLVGPWYMFVVVGTLPLIMMARIHLGSHYPSDTIAGALIGVGIIGIIVLCIPAFTAWYTWGFHNLEYVFQAMFG